MNSQMCAIHTMFRADAQTLSWGRAGSLLLQHRISEELAGMDAIAVRIHLCHSVKCLRNVKGRSQPVLNTCGGWESHTDVNAVCIGAELLNGVVEMLAAR